MQPGKKVFLLAVLIASLICAAVRAEEIPYAQNLPPGEKPVEVQVRFFLSKITDINEQDETFEIKGLLMLEWMDARQKFSPAVEGVAEKTFQGAYQFLEVFNGWWPQLVISNGVGTVPLQNVSLKISPDGTMLYIQEISAVVEHPMNLRAFPFDRQQLNIIFEPLAFFGTEVKLVFNPGMYDLPDYPIDVAGWKFHDLSAYTDIDLDDNSGKIFSQFILQLELERLPASIIWLVMVPLSIIVLLATSIYWMDKESLGNRMDISFLGILTIVAYQSLVESSLPRVEYFTLISGFIYVAYAIMITCIISNIIVDKLDRSGKGDVADRLDLFGRWLVPAGFFALNIISGLWFYYL